MRVRKKGNGNDFMFIWCPGSFMVKQMFFSCQWTATIIRDRYTNPEGTGPSSVQGHSRLQLAECLFSSSWYLCNHAAKNWEPEPSFPPRPFPGLLLQTTLNCSFLFQKVCLAFFRCHRAMSTSLPLLWWIGHPDYPWVLVLYSLGHSPICSLQGFWDESACRAFASSSPGRCSSFCLRATAAQLTPHSSPLLACFTIPGPGALAFLVWRSTPLASDFQRVIFRSDSVLPSLYHCRPDSEPAPCSRQMGRFWVGLWWLLF